MNLIKFKPKFLVVETPAEGRLQPLTQEEESAVLSLNGHPGFEILCKRLQLSRRALEGQLCSTKHKTIREVDALQAGIFWCRWLEEQVAKAVDRARVKKEKPLSSIEKETLSTVYSAFEIIK